MLGQDDYFRAAAPVSRRDQGASKAFEEGLGLLGLVLVEGSRGDHRVCLVDVTVDVAYQLVERIIAASALESIIEILEKEPHASAELLKRSRRRTSQRITRF